MRSQRAAPAGELGRTRENRIDFSGRTSRCRNGRHPHQRVPLRSTCPYLHRGKLLAQSCGQRLHRESFAGIMPRQDQRYTQRRCLQTGVKTRFPRHQHFATRSLRGQQEITRAAARHADALHQPGKIAHVMQPGNRQELTRATDQLRQRLRIRQSPQTPVTLVGYQRILCLQRLDLLQAQAGRELLIDAVACRIPPGVWTVNGRLRR